MNNSKNPPKKRRGGKRKIDDSGKPMDQERKKLATSQDFLSKHKTAFMQLSDENWIEYQRLAPGDFMELSGSPLQREMTEAGLDYEDKEERDDYIDSMAQESQVIVLNAFLDNAKRIVAKSIISVNVSILPQDQCTGDLISIENISDWDVIKIYTEVAKLSGVKPREVERFPQDSGTDKGSGGEGQPS